VSGRLSKRLRIVNPRGIPIRRSEVWRDALARLGASCDAGGFRLPYAAWNRRFLPHLFPLPNGRMHDDLDRLWADIAVQRGVRMNVLGCRGVAKTTRTRSLVLRSAVEGTEPYILLISDTSPQAEQQLANVREEIESNREIARAYPGAAGIGPKWRDDFLVLRNGVRIDALGTGKRLRGRIRRARRPTLIVCDDLQNDEQVLSSVQRQKAWNWFVRALLKAGEPGVTNIVNLASTLHPDAIAVRLSKHGGWTTSRYPAIEAWPERMDLWGEWEELVLQHENEDREKEAEAFYRANESEMNRGCELGWKERFPLYGLMVERSMGHAAFDAEMQLQPIDPALCEFDPAYFDGVMVKEWPKVTDLRTIAIDPSKGKKDKGGKRAGDLASIVKFGREAVTGLLYFEAEMMRVPARKIVERAVDQWIAFQPDAMGIETDVFQELFLTVFEVVTKERGVTLAVHEMPTGGVPKAVRIRRLDSYLARRLCRFVDTAGTRMLVEQLRGFPMADFDDGPDAMEQAVRLAIRMDGERMAKTAAREWGGEGLDAMEGGGLEVW